MLHLRLPRQLQSSRTSPLLYIHLIRHIMDCIPAVQSWAHKHGTLGNPLLTWLFFQLYFFLSPSRISCRLWVTRTIPRSPGFIFTPAEPKHIANWWANMHPSRSKESLLRFLIYFYIVVIFVEPHLLEFSHCDVIHHCLVHPEQLLPAHKKETHKYPVNYQVYAIAFVNCQLHKFLNSPCQEGPGHWSGWFR